MAKDKRDKCKCGKIICWDVEESKIKCKYCNTEYTVEADSVLVYWLEEIIESPKRFKTEARY